MNISQNSRLNKVRVRYGHWIFKIPGLRRYSGMVIYPFMLFRAPERGVTDRLFRHELAHVYQVWRHGWIGFYFGYLMESIRHGYKNNQFEIEANAVGSLALDKAERHLKENGKMASFIPVIITITLIVFAVVVALEIMDDWS